MLSLDQAEILANNDENVWWEGWTLMIWKPARTPLMFDKNAYYNRRTNEWGTIKRVQPDSNGMYRVPNYLQRTLKSAARA
jgi:hypothetical protein